MEQSATRILQRIKEFYDYENDHDLANLLEVTPSSVSNYRKRDALNFKLIFTKCRDVSLNWLIWGLGYPSLDDALEGNPIVTRLKNENALLKEMVADKDQIIELLKGKEASQRNA